MTSWPENCECIWCVERRAKNAVAAEDAVTRARTAGSAVSSVPELDISKPETRFRKLTSLEAQCYAPLSETCQYAEVRVDDGTVWNAPVPLPSPTEQFAPPTERFIDRLTSEQRKQYPMATGFVDYFPDAMAAVSHISWLGNEKHNKGQPLHWARGKSNDQADCLMRHHSTRHSADPAYRTDTLAPVFHMAEAAWRALAQLQEAMESQYGLARAPGAKE